MLYVLCLTAPFVLHSQNLNDFKTAASSDGVNLIPFTDLRQEAASIANEVDSRKGDIKDFDYDVLEKQKNNLLKDIKKRNGEIERIQKEIDEFKKLEFSTACMETEVESRKKMISDNNDKIKDMNDKLKRAAEAFDRLAQARGGLREYFEKALSQLSGVSSDFAKYIGSSPSDDDKKALDDAVRTIQDKINAGVKDHRDQEEGAKKRKSDYEELLNRTEPR